LEPSDLRSGHRETTLHEPGAMDERQRSVRFAISDQDRLLKTIDELSKALSTHRCSRASLFRLPTLDGLPTHSIMPPVK
jgi:hypothetical protein